MTDFHPPWRVLLICGSSGSGKTTVGRRLAERFGISLLLADDVRMAIQAVTTAQEQPSLHTFTVAQSPAMDSPESVLAGLVTVAEALEPALRMIMAHHLVVEGVGAIILEGDGLLPRLANPAYLKGQPEFTNVNVEGRVKGVVLFEAEREVVRRNMETRGRGFQNAPLSEQDALSLGSWLFGNYLVEQATVAGVAVLPSRPFDTLDERLLPEILIEEVTTDFTEYTD